MKHHMEHKASNTSLVPHPCQFLVHETTEKSRHLMHRAAQAVCPGLGAIQTACRGLFWNPGCKPCVVRAGRLYLVRGTKYPGSSQGARIPEQTRVPVRSTGK